MKYLLAISKIQTSTQVFILWEFNNGSLYIACSGILQVLKIWQVSNLNFIWKWVLQGYFECFKNKFSYQWLLPNCEWIYTQRLKVLKRWWVWCPKLIPDILENPRVFQMAVKVKMVSCTYYCCSFIQIIFIRFVIRWENNKILQKHINFNVLEL